ncbi:flagellar FlbD family protein [Dermatophilus congolensis]|uniref:Flagellar protein (FlbD) n=1 Tax=Dermatophilus congolensis TaxID=1863 RepID=A0A239VUD4_9MICO|nr:flagellar FlbD family protein [Dermatophilus congolensis]MBO3129988.1 flagellar FlbD family protein [Dermatophilus congolensis]MBO3131382.1 flagellar FlbD family protein [Dermatophilus congolensis]MBO3134462.1 flagellar FlbD family protein [Dermatophilus congolensis]MBO3136697.1 flagellar FlbD family protein [Dermatophilus congolensis]MBO3138942.1 flagellar FlbD family protein [Dermatophilus congolensis]
MIICTRRNGTSFALNPDLIERIEATPDTVITLVSGTKYVVAEPVDDLVHAVRDFRASVLIATNTPPSPDVPRQARLRSVSNPES